MRVSPLGYHDMYICHWWTEGGGVEGYVNGCVGVGVGGGWGWRDR